MPKGTNCFENAEGEGWKQPKTDPKPAYKSKTMIINCVLLCVAALFLFAFDRWLFELPESVKGVAGATIAMSIVNMLLRMATISPIKFREKL